MKIMRQRWTHQFHSPKHCAWLLDSSHCLFLRDWLYLPPSFTLFVTSSTLLETFVSPLNPFICHLFLKSNFINQATLLHGPLHFFASLPLHLKNKQMDTSPVNVAIEIILPYSSTQVMSTLILIANLNTVHSLCLKTCIKRNTTGKEINTNNKNVCFDGSIVFLCSSFRQQIFCI